MGGLSEDRSDGDAFGGTSWIWEFSTGVLSESWGEIPALRVWGDWPPPLLPLKEASIWGAIEEGGKAKKLLSH